MNTTIIDGEYLIILDNNGKEVSRQINTKLPSAIPAVDPCLWLIDIGTFFDRFGSFKTAILTSTDIGAQAIIKDCSVRKWIDLKNPEISPSCDYLISKGLLDVPTKTNILTTPVADAENMACRKLYFTQG